MKTDRESMRFGVRKQDVEFVRLNRTSIADKPLRFVKFVLHDTDNRDHEACTFQDIVRHTHLRFAAINNEYSRERPFGMI